MKKIFLSLIFSISFFFLSAQSNSIEYLSAITDLDGIPIANKNVSLQIKILQGSATGTVVYTEDHNLISGPGGQVLLDIGEGQNASSAFENVDWSYPNFIEMLIDLDGGTNFISYKTTELLSVPYALFALNVDCQRTCVPIDGMIGQDGIQGEQGPQGIQGSSGLFGADGQDGPQGQLGISGAETLSATDQVPLTPESGRFYIDDGTNRLDGNVGFRYFDGTNWLDL